MKVAETNLFQSIEYKHKPILKNHIIPMSTDETSTEKTRKIIKKVTYSENVDRINILSPTP